MPVCEVSRQRSRKDLGKQNCSKLTLERHWWVSEWRRSYSEVAATRNGSGIRFSRTGAPMNSLEGTIVDVDQALVEVGLTVIWRAKDGDYPVTIVADLGLGPDGRRYVSVTLKE